MLTLVSCQPATDKKDASKASETKTDLKSDKKAEGEIVYVNTDSLIKNYEFYKKADKEMVTRKSGAMSDLETRGMAIKNEETVLIQRANSMTVGDLEVAKRNLQAKAQNFTQYEESVSKQVGEEERQLAEKMSKNLEDFMKRYAEANGYKMILSYKQGATVWYADPKLDITAAAIKAINEEYSKQSTAPTTPPVVAPVAK